MAGDDDSTIERIIQGLREDRLPPHGDEGTTIHEVERELGGQESLKQYLEHERKHEETCKQQNKKRTW